MDPIGTTKNPWSKSLMRKIEWDVGLNVFDPKSAVRMLNVDYAEKPSYTSAVLDPAVSEPHSFDRMNAALKKVAAAHDQLMMDKFFSNTPTNALVDLDKIATEIVAQDELAKMIEQDPAFGSF